MQAWGDDRANIWGFGEFIDAGGHQGVHRANRSARTAARRVPTWRKDRPFKSLASPAAFLLSAIFSSCFAAPSSVNPHPQQATKGVHCQPIEVAVTLYESLVYELVNSFLADAPDTLNLAIFLHTAGEVTQPFLENIYTIEINVAGDMTFFSRSGMPR